MTVDGHLWKWTVKFVENVSSFFPGPLHRYWQVNVDDFMSVTIFGHWWHNFDIDDILWILVPLANVKRWWWRKRPKPSPISQSYRQHQSSSVANICLQHRCSRSFKWPLSIMTANIHDQPHSRPPTFKNLRDLSIKLCSRKCPSTSGQIKERPKERDRNIHDQHWENIF